MNSYKLIDVAQIITGYSFRTKIVPASNGNLSLIQAKDIGDDLKINNQSLVSISLDHLNTSALVKNDDVILTSRGQYRASVATSIKPFTIASSSVFIVRPTNKILNPYFLAIFLNSKFAQNQLKRLTSNRHLSSISKSNLENLIIQIPPIDKQKLIINFYQNIEQQQKLLNQKNKILTNIFSASFINVINSQN